MSEQVTSSPVVGGEGTESQPAPREQTPSAGFLLDHDTNAKPVISVVIPTLNEEQGIAQCIEAVETALNELRLPGEVIVSDGSTDRTPEIAREMGAVVVEPDAPGYGYAYRYAFEHARGEVVVIGDADTTYDFSELPTLLERLESTDADIVLGSRLDGEIKPGAMPALHQYVGNPLLTRFLNAFYDAGVSDAHSGFRVIRREVIDELELTTDGMEFASEMIMAAAAQDYRIEEVPITYHEREGEATLDSFRDGWRHVKFMTVNAPNYLFSFPGGLWMLVGLGVMGASYSTTPAGGLHLGLHTMIAGSLLTILGWQVWSLGVLATVASNPIQSPSDRITQFIIGNVSLEHGTLLGTGLATLGVVLVAGVGLRSVGVETGGVTVMKEFTVACTVTVLGLLMVFESFFFGLVHPDTST
jgi:glycosyltransferase involved in cell wall biosynthesis